MRKPEEIQIRDTNLYQILELHRLWLKNDKRGKQANLAEVDLHEVDLHKVDLSEANLRGVDLRYANLREANLSTADLREADLRETDFQKADLCEANLSRAMLRNANMQEANLNSADLTETHLREANFSGADLTDANLFAADMTRINLHNADLSDADLYMAFLNEADLSNAFLSEANMRGTILHGANLREADFYRADLRRADFDNADLLSADFSHTILTNCSFIDTNCQSAIFRHAAMTGVILLRTITDDWDISDVTCDYIYLDTSRIDRYPKERNFKPGEFESLHRSIPTVEYIFRNGMQWIDGILMNGIAMDLQSENPDYGIRLIKLENNNHFPKAVFEIRSNENKTTIENELTKRYETLLAELEQDPDQWLNIILKSVQHPRRQIITVPQNETAENKLLKINELKNAL